MSVLYCTVPHFAAALARREDPALDGRPIVLIGPDGGVFGASAEAAACGIIAGMAARTAEVRCPEARLLEADVTRCRQAREILLQVLEQTGPKVEPHGWGSAYVDLDDLAGGYSSAVSLCREVGRAVRQELGEALQPALGWDSSKFTAQAAARCMMRPGHLRAVSATRERGFLQPLPVTLLPLAADVLQRLIFLGLRTLGQVAALPPGAVWQQFGRAGKLAYRCARGEDDRPVVPRYQAPHVTAAVELESPLVERERLMAELQCLVSPMLAELRASLQACGQVRLTVQFDDGTAQEGTRIFLFPLATEGRIVGALGQLLDGLRWRGSAAGLSVELGQVQDAVVEQLTLFPLEDRGRQKLGKIQRYLSTRFDRPREGGNGFEGSRLRRAVMAQPGAPLPEWRISWQTGDGL